MAVSRALMRNPPFEGSPVRQAAPDLEALETV